MEVTGLALQLAEPTGEGWTQVIEILFALLLSSAIGLERELGQKNAGLRTHALVGVGGCHFLVVEGYPRIVSRFGAHNFFVTTFGVRYLDGRGLLRTILAAATQRGFMVSEITTSSIESEYAANEDTAAYATSDRVGDVRLQLQGPLSVHDLTAVLSEIDGVISLTAGTSFERASSGQSGRSET
jgi:hypothetical protein